MIMTWKDEIRKDVDPYDNTAMLNSQISGIRGIKPNVAIELLNAVYNNDEGKLRLTEKQIQAISNTVGVLDSMDKDTIITKLAVISALGLRLKEFDELKIRMGE